jgi:hypothetical protein
MPFSIRPYRRFPVQCFVTYTTQHPHRALGYQPPASRSTASVHRRRGLGEMVSALCHRHSVPPIEGGSFKGDCSEAC